MNTLPQGTFWCGDPCYVIDQDQWHEFCKILSPSSVNRVNNQIVQFKGRQVFVSQTAYGDGSYGGSDGNSYAVDSGLIGAVPIELVSNKYNKEDLLRLGAFHTFDTQFEVGERDGTFHIGWITIWTGKAPNQDGQEEQC